MAQSPSPQKALGKFDLVITFGSEDDAHCAMYYKHFRALKRTKVEKTNFSRAQSYDALILPLPTSFGLSSSKSTLLGQLMKYVLRYIYKLPRFTCNL